MNTPTSDLASAISAKGLRKSFGDHVVLDGIDLNVAPGTVYALLGPSGAGKTTAVQILSTLIRADDGVVHVAGHDPNQAPDAVRAAIGVTGQFSAVDNVLTGEENLLLMADLHHLPRAEGRQRASHLLSRFVLSMRGPSVSRRTPVACGEGVSKRPFSVGRCCATQAPTPACSETASARRWYGYGRRPTAAHSERPCGSHLPRGLATGVRLFAPALRKRRAG